MHKPVLLREVLKLLDLKPGDCVLDGTLGGGGHAEAVLEVIGPKGFLIGLDQDAEALERSKERLHKYSKQCAFIHCNFDLLDEALNSLHIEAVNAVLLDIGISSDQLDHSQRGFSFKEDGPLDMRMNTAQGHPAAELVRLLSEKELADLIFHWGEERLSRQIARAICRTRLKTEIQTTMQLATLIKESVPPSYRYGRIHPATRTFQALRIAVNDELGSLERALPKALHVLRTNGKLAVISFHSLEDRLVKHFFQEQSRTGAGKILTRKPIQPSEQEVCENPRARSAKLRVFERS